jgi:hypothetical protein
MNQLLIRHEIADLSLFTLLELHQMEEKRAFIDRGQLCIYSSVNGHPLRVIFSDMTAPLASDLQNSLPGYRQVMIVMPEFRIVAKPLSVPVVIDDKVRLPGAMIVTPDGPAICAVFAAGEERDEPGRICVNLANGTTIFHYRQSPVAYEQWELVWMNQHNEKIMSLTRHE